MKTGKYSLKRFSIRYKWVNRRNRNFDYVEETHLFNASSLRQLSKDILKTYVGKRSFFIPTQIFLADIQNRLDGNKTPSLLICQLRAIMPTETLDYYNSSIDNELDNILRLFKRQLRNKIICEAAVTEDYTMVLNTVYYTHYEDNGYANPSTNLRTTDR